MSEVGSSAAGGRDQSVAPSATIHSLRLAGTNSLAMLDAKDSKLTLLRAACSLEASLRREAKQLSERTQRPDVMRATTGASSLERAADEAAQLIRQIDALVSNAARVSSERGREGAVGGSS